MVCDLLLWIFPLVRKINRQLRIQIGRLVKAALDFLLPESRLLKNLAIRKEIDLRSRFFRLSNDRKKPLVQFHHRYAPLIAVVVDRSVPADLHIHILGKGIDNGGAHPMKPAACLVNGVVKLPARMKRRVDDPRR